MCSLDLKPSLNGIEPYSTNIYNTVAQFQVNRMKFAEGGRGQQAINTVIRDCFLSHGVEKEYSACLIHKHYDLAPNERNVENNGKATASSDLSGIHACSWLFHDGKCYPYEYTRRAVPEPKKEFVEALGKVLEDAGVTDLFGIQRYTDGMVGLETTEHDVSTTVEQDEKMEIPAHMGAAASWAFFAV